MHVPLVKLKEPYRFAPSFLVILDVCCWIYMQKFQNEFGELRLIWTVSRCLPANMRIFKCLHSTQIVVSCPKMILNYNDQCE
jgi:hypothetical protein